MDWIKRYKNRIIIGLVIIVVLAAAFIIGGRTNYETAPEKKPIYSVSESTQQSSAVSERTDDTVSTKSKTSAVMENTGSQEVESSASDESSVSRAASKTEEAKAQSDTSFREESKPAQIASKTQESVYVSSTPSVITPKPSDDEHGDAGSNTEEAHRPEPSVSSEASKPVLKQHKTEKSTAQVQTSVVSDESDNTVFEKSCTIYISCFTAMNNSNLSRAKRSVLPSDGVIMHETQTGFNSGESAFDVLKRVCKQNSIHLDFISIPVTGGVYIRGINNLYEYDCGGVSGWMYKVNDEFPNVGCSDIKLNEGDRIEFLYSCDLGADIGNIYVGD